VVLLVVPTLPLDGLEVLTDVDVLVLPPPGLPPPPRWAIQVEPIRVNAIKKTIFLIKL
jgi:hypothetical protein